MHTTAKVSELTNRNLPARNRLVQLLALYADPDSTFSVHTFIGDELNLTL